MEDPDTKNRNNYRFIAIKTYPLSALNFVQSDCPATAEGLRFLIQSRAAFYRIPAQDDLSKIKSLLNKSQNTFKGYVFYAQNIGPVAYVTYAPSVDPRGQRGIHCTDFFILEAYRGLGIANIILRTLAKTIKHENAAFLQWDAELLDDAEISFLRNKAKAIKSDLITLRFNDCSNTLPNCGETTSRALKPLDISKLESASFNPDLIRKNGDSSFHGIISFNRKSLNSAAAITPGWSYTSTTGLSKGICLQEPSCPADSQQPLISILNTLFKLAAQNKYTEIKWQVSPKALDKLAVALRGYDVSANTSQGIYLTESKDLKEYEQPSNEDIIAVSIHDPIGLRGKRNIRPNNP